MERRHFLRSITAGLAAAALDPEKLLWIPGQKTIFIPPPLRHITGTEILALQAAYRRDMEKVLAIIREICDANEGLVVRGWFAEISNGEPE